MHLRVSKRGDPMSCRSRESKCCKKTIGSQPLAKRGTYVLVKG